MGNKKMNCQNCNTLFNKRNRKPILMPCKHTFCFKCIYKLKKEEIFNCPIDNKLFDKFTSYPTNNEILKNIDNNDKNIDQSNKNIFIDDNNDKKDNNNESKDSEFIYLNKSNDSEEKLNTKLE